ncbi:SseB family protein [Microbacterium luticocti]|uniref:SseB family protein n=1 Tax=Microbacterium luticocti TaxID=451764 RepID=UPI00041F2A25|nr:SseB family protein [Microbacterium luticocti]
MALFSRGPKANDSEAHVDDDTAGEATTDAAAGASAADEVAGGSAAGVADAAGSAVGAEGVAGASGSAAGAEGSGAEGAGDADAEGSDARATIAGDTVTDAAAVASTPATENAAEGAAGAVDGPAAADAPGDTVPQVGISTTSYGGFGADTTAEALPSEPAAAAEPTGEAPPPHESLPGLPDNVVLRAALAALGADPEPTEILNVARQLLQGTVYLRVKGNAQELMAAGGELPLAIATRDEGQFVMLYSSGDALADAVRADGDTETSAMGQAAPAVLQYVLQGDFAGVMVDHASAPAAVVLPRALIERMFSEMDPQLTLKRLVTGPRTAETAAEIATAMTTAPLWIAVNRASEDDEWGVAESHTEAGERILPVFSHPLEVVALGRNDRPAPFAPAQLGHALRGDTGIDGVVLDPAGPWIRLSREDLAPVMALPDPAPAEQIADEDQVADDE